MTRPDAYLGVDLGTSGLKVALVDGSGALVAQAEASYVVAVPHPGWAETDPDEWWAAVRSALDRIADPLRRHRVRGVAVDGQMHGVVLCDGAGRGVRPAVLWPDTRAGDHVARWAALPMSARSRLANPLVPGMSGPFLAWLADEEPDAVSRADVALLPKDVIRARLGGGVVTDRSDASATLLWDVVSDSWADDVAAGCGVPVRLLPDVVVSDAVVGRVRPEGGCRGLEELADATLVAGCGDTPAALLAVETGGATVVNLGTGAQVLRREALASPVADPPVHTYADTDRGWYRMAAAQNGGLALEWVLRVLGADWEEAVAALDVAPSSDVTFLPFLTGERGSVAPPGSTASWRGLGLATTRADLLRSALEAMAFAVRRCHDLLDASGAPAPSAGSAGAPVRVMGGGTRSAQVQQLLADVLQAPVQRLALRSASAAGAAVLAARAEGVTLTPPRADGPVVDPRSDEGLQERYGAWLGLAAGRVL